MLVTGNTVFGHDGSGDVGIQPGGAIVSDNEVYGNTRGIEGSGEIRGNRIYGNTEEGIYSGGRADMMAADWSYSRYAKISATVCGCSF